HSQSACDCYCKTRVPIARQREEIQSARSRVRDSRSSVPKTDAIRSARKIPLVSAKVVDDEQFDSKRSTITLPVTPDLSPETSATLDDVQKLIKDAQIRMKEISIVTNCNRLPKNMSVCPDEAPLDDENDQLLYIRERVAHKFQEANGWVDTSSTDSRIQLSGEGHPLAKPKRVVDLSAPKFRTSEDRYKEFSRQRKLDIRKLGLPSSLADDAPVNDENGKLDDQARSPRRERDRGIDACSIQTCPPVNIKGDLITQNLQNIHISPDPFFVQESQNVGTYAIVHNFSRKTESPRRREKVIKISEHSNDDKNNGRRRKSDSRDYSDNGSTRDLERSGRAGISVANDEKLTEDAKEARETSVTNLENVENSEPMAFKDSKIDYGERMLEGSAGPMDARDVNSEDEANDGATKVGSRNDQKQVRFEEQASKPESCEDRFELQNRGGSDATLVQDLKIPLTSLELKIQEVLKDNIEQFRRSSALREVEPNDEHVPLSSKEIEEKHRINKRRHKEICEKRGAKDEDYKIIDKRFANIVKTYCTRDDNGSEDRSHVLSSSMISSEDSTESDDLYDLYEPPLNEFDDVLASYNKIIDNIVRTTKTIDEFLSRPELDEYRAESTSQTKINKKSVSVNPTLLNKGRIVSIETNNSLPSRTKHCTNRPDNRSTNVDTNLDKSKRSRSVPAPTKRSVYPSNDEPKNRCIVPKTPTRRPSIKTKDRLDAQKKTQSRETTGSSEDNSKSNKMSRIVDSKRTRPLETRSLRLTNDMSSLTTSSTCPQSSSTDTKTTNDTRVSEEVSKSTTNDENDGVATTLRINTLDVNERKTQQDNLDCATLQDVLKQGFPETKRDLIAHVKDKEIKDILNVNEIVPLMVRGLLESLRSEVNFGKLKLLVSEGTSPRNPASAHDREIKMIEAWRSDGESECQSSQSDRPPSKNLSTTETVECNDEIIDGHVSNQSDHEEAFNSGNQSSRSNETIPRSKAEHWQNESTEISSSTYHSEGELYMPSSGSYSLGEIRMLMKSQSDGENTDDFDDNVSIFVTKKMLTSWNESSK
ncbi:hypothetical protein WN48_06853, partial [Eufriesea mexicana]